MENEQWGPAGKSWVLSRVPLIRSTFLSHPIATIESILVPWLCICFPGTVLVSLHLLSWCNYSQCSTSYSKVPQLGNKICNDTNFSLSPYILSFYVPLGEKKNCQPIYDTSIQTHSVFRDVEM